MISLLNNLIWRKSMFRNKNNQDRNNQNINNQGIDNQDRNNQGINNKDRNKQETGNQDSGNEHKMHSIMKYVGMMGVCCLVPIVIIGILPLLRINSLSTNVLISGMASLICPIMMGVMMIVMFRSGKRRSCCSKDSNSEGIEK